MFECVGLGSVVVGGFLLFGPVALLAGGLAVVVLLEVTGGGKTKDR